MPILETDDIIANLMKDDANDTGDGAGSDEEGEGYAIITNLHEGMAEGHRKNMPSDYQLIEENILHSEGNGIKCNVIDSSLDGWSPSLIPHD